MENAEAGEGMQEPPSKKMGKIAAFEVKFAQNKTEYFPGDTINGEILLQLNCEMKMNAIKIKFIGKAYIQWTENYYRGNGVSRECLYFGSENFFEHAVLVHGEESSSVEYFLPNGQHIFPFHFQLPSPLPSTYKDSRGHVRYYVEGIIVKPSKVNRNTIADFTVNDTLDLNTIPDLTEPTGGSGSKYLGCLYCRSGPIEADFHTDKSGYVPGESIVVNASLTNSSIRKVKSTSVRLVKCMTYHATLKTKTFGEVVCTARGPKCHRRSSISLENVKLLIPPLAHSELKHCRLIDIAYFVMFEARFGNRISSLKLLAPITIGTVPLKGLNVKQNPGDASKQIPLETRQSPSTAPGLSSAEKATCIVDEEVSKL